VCKNDESPNLVKYNYYLTRNNDRNISVVITRR